MGLYVHGGCCCYCNFGGYFSCCCCCLFLNNKKEQKNKQKIKIRKHETKRNPKIRNKKIKERARKEETKECKNVLSKQFYIHININVHLYMIVASEHFCALCRDFNPPGSHLLLYKMFSKFL